MEKGAAHPAEHYPCKVTSKSLISFGLRAWTSGFLTLNLQHIYQVTLHKGIMVLERLLNIFSPLRPELSPSHKATGVDPNKKAGVAHIIQRMRPLLAKIPIGNERKWSF